MRFINLHFTYFTYLHQPRNVPIAVEYHVDKSDVTTLVTASQLRSAWRYGWSSRRCNHRGRRRQSSRPVKPEMKSLGFIIDSHLRFDKHAAAVAKACNYHIHALRHVRHLLTDRPAPSPAAS